MPELADPKPLAKLLDSWPAARRLMICDETGGGPPILAAVAALEPQLRAAPWAILIGPEGGFTRAELDRIGTLPGVHAVGLGPRILRADTAALAALIGSRVAEERNIPLSRVRLLSVGTGFTASAYPPPDARFPYGVLGWLRPRQDDGSAPLVTSAAGSGG